MKARVAISATALFMLLGTTVPVFAQGEQHEQQAKPEQHEGQAKPASQEAHTKQQQARPAQQAKPARRQQQPRTAKQETQTKPVRHQQQAKAAKPAQAKPEQEREQAKSAKPEVQTKPVRQEGGRPAAQPHVQRTAAEQQKQRAVPALRLSARSNSRIPDDRFRSNFGSGHEFRIGTPTMVGGYSRFQYGGYWFGFVQPWPAGWYYTDDVYVDYISGTYYLCNPSYPGARVAISVVL